MPGNLAPAEPTQVMPYSLAAAFEETLFLDAFINEYADGRSERRAGAFNARRTFRVARRLSDEQLEDLRTFYYDVARYGAPFWFYNVRETTPPYTWDETGSNPVGRYAVVWEGGWNDTITFGRHESQFVLREVIG